MIRTIHIDFNPDDNDTLWIVGPDSEIVVNLPHDQITRYNKEAPQDDIPTDQEG